MRRVATLAALALTLAASALAEPRASAAAPALDRPTMAAEAPAAPTQITATTMAAELTVALAAVTGEPIEALAVTPQRGTTRRRTALHSRRASPLNDLRSSGLALTSHAPPQRL